MKLSEFNYNLPEKLIAQKPVRPRDSSRLCVIGKDQKNFQHLHFYTIARFFKKGDVLVLNNSKVIPARLHAKKNTGGVVEILLVRKSSPFRWIALLKNFKKSDIGKILTFDEARIRNQESGVKKRTTSLTGKPIKKISNELWEVEFNRTGTKLKKILEHIGTTPTPPYIKTPSDLATYQTVYAKKPGSVAAPTAGFHFTQKLLSHLKNKGVSIHYVTLHVGPGTFSPIRVDDIRKHRMHGECASIDKKTAHILTQAKKHGKRIIAVGTTTVRTLESFTDTHGTVHSGTKEVDLFIYPGYVFKIVDSLVTNFHLPQSTLLILVCAFAEWKMKGGPQIILNAYREAVKKKYRFTSFGDAMFIQ